MNRRPDPAHEETDRIIERMEKEIAKEYKQAHEEMAAKLNDYLRKRSEKDEIWRKWVEDAKGAERKRRQKKYRKWVTRQVLTGKRWQEMRDILAHDYLNAHRIAESIVNGHMAEVYALNHNYGTYAIERGLRVDTSYTLYSREAVERLWRDNPKIYHDPGEATAQAIKDGEIVAWNKQRVQSAMTQGILQGESIPHLAERLKSVTGGELAAAIRNARTMTTGIQNAGRIDAMKRAQLMGIKTRKQWLAALDNRTRHGHRQLDGVIKDVDEPFENEYGKIMYPGDPTVRGINIYNCRCTLLYALEGHEIDVTDPRVRPNKSLGDMSYEDWKASKKRESRPIDYQKKLGEAMKASYLKDYRRMKGGH